MSDSRRNSAPWAQTAALSSAPPPGGLPGTGCQLNKGENLHALKRSLAYAAEGALRRRHHEEQASRCGA